MALSYVAVCNASILRIAQDPTTTAPAAAAAATTAAGTTAAATTTTGPLINAILENERFINKTATRFNTELDTIRVQVGKLNATLQSWNFNLGVLDETASKDDSLIANNTETLQKANDTAGFKAVEDKSNAFLAKINVMKASKDAVEKELIGGTASNGTADTSELSSLLPRIEKAKRAYLLNGTQMENMLGNMKRVEGDISVNSTILVERILRRETDDAMAAIPKEMQRQLEAIS